MSFCDNQGEPPKTSKPTDGKIETANTKPTPRPAPKPTPKPTPKPSPGTPITKGK